MNKNICFKNKNGIFALSRRKKSVVKLILFANGEGKMYIRTGKFNDYKFKTELEYFRDKFIIQNLLLPLSLKPNNKYDILAHVSGGGIISQSYAIKHCLAKVLLQEDPELKPTLKKYKLLTQDTRSKERKKIGKYGARRSPQFTKR